ncbi:MAG: hypothetical protein LBS98_00150 [Coriobacteriales bacterium]|jgi:FKBP-type peptidyl-prolyl cis-trans isomerase (trigger factor)|nr:hypothetical protein [Coriobacteriales bacterium]
MTALETSSRRLEDNKVEVKVVISAAEVDKGIAAAYKEAARVRIPGFRPGKAPRHVLDNNYGGKEYFLGKTTDDLVKETFPLAIDSEGFVPLDSPDFPELDIVKEGEEYQYTTTFTVSPVYELSSYEPVQIELPSEEATPEEIQSQVDSLLEYYVDFEEVDGEQVKKLPELTDEWVKEKLEYESVEEFKNRVAESIKAQKSYEIPGLKNRLVTTELASRLEGEPTELLVNQAEQSIYRDFFSTLQKNQLTLDAYLAQTGLTSEGFRADVKQQAAAEVAQELALGALARHLALEISDDEIHEEFANSGAQNPEELYADWKANGRLSEIREGLLRMKAARHLVDTAEVFELGKKPAAKKAAKKAAGKKPATEEESAGEKGAEKKATATKKSAAEKKPTSKKAGE